MGKTSIAREIEVNASREQVWNAISDIGNICHASPGVVESHVTSEKGNGVGATRHCDFAMMGASAEERVTGWKDGEYLKIEAYELKKLPGMKTMEAEFFVHERNGKALLKGTLHYSMKNFLFALMNGVMVKRMNTRSWEGVMAGYKQHIETGETVTRKTRLDFDAVKPV